jgi:hypothetical protein
LADIGVGSELRFIPNFSPIVEGEKAFELFCENLSKIF